LLDSLALGADVKLVPLGASEATRLVAHFDTPAGPRSIGACSASPKLGIES
jgi:hypothetical protein